MIHETCSTRAGDDDHSITLCGSAEEINKIRRMLRGMTWVSVRRDPVRLVEHPSMEPLPAPYADPCLSGNWPQLTEEKLRQSRLVFQTDSESLTDFINQPQFLLSHICGYSYTERFYREMAEKLESCGFVCCRSRRNEEGTFHEFWYLSSLILAKGPLREFLQSQPELSDAATWRVNTRPVLEWLCRNFSFGSCDVLTQRVAAVID